MQKKDLELNEELGEMVCDKCEGAGSCNTTYSEETSPYYWRCPKCKGKGKVDWVENILGAKPLLVRGLSASFVTMDELDFFKNSEAHEFIELLSREISKDIDNEILRSLKEDSEQNNKNQ